MNIKFYKSILAGGLTSCVLCSCGMIEGNNPIIEENNIIQEEPEVVNLQNSLLSDSAVSENKPAVNQLVKKLDEDSLDYNTFEIDYIVADKDTEILDGEGNLVGKLAVGRGFPFVEHFDDDYYLMDYYGKTTFVRKSDCHTETKPVVNQPIIAKGYVTKDTYLYPYKELTHCNGKLNNHEFVEIIKEYDRAYLVQTIDTVGFITKDNVELVEGNMAVVDISNQELRLYEGNDMTVCTPVVTGTENDPDRKSDEGLFNVRLKAKDLYIVPGAWVDTVVYYNRGEGIHTSEWRKIYEYGYTTYLNNGSHGCINTPREDAIYCYEVLNEGDYVLVKK